MKILVNEKFSQHKMKTPEGYLICTDAILARTGKQEYLKRELFGDSCDDGEERVDVDRPYDEVFSKETLASFENKPVTIEHPNEDVNISNYKDYAVGYVRDIRQSNIDGIDVIVGDLVITDEDAISKIESDKMTNLSCGYDCEIKDNNKGEYIQTKIRGNHVALCEEGRAGNARIIDSKVKDRVHAVDIIKMIKPLIKKGINAVFSGRDYLEITFNDINYPSDDINNAYNFLKKEGYNVSKTFHSVKIHFPQGLDSNVDDSISKDDLRKYLRWEGISESYLEPILEHAKKGKDDLDKYLKWEGILGYTETLWKKINDSLNIDSLKDKFTNDLLRDFKIEDLVNKVIQKKEYLNSIREGSDGSIYYIIISGRFKTDLKKGNDTYLDITKEDVNGNQKRVLSKSSNSWKELINNYNSWRRSIKDSTLTIDKALKAINIINKIK